MKIEKRGVVALIFLLIFQTGTALIAQETAILDSFTLNKNDGKIYLNWVIRSGSTCDGTKILRSTDQVHFEEIGEILGICGSASFPVGYEFVDENPVKNQRNYYLLELGRSGTSEIASIEILDLHDKGYQIRPNPANTQTTIYFDNDKQEKHLLVLYHLDGVLVHTSVTFGSFVDIYTANLPVGLYFFTISGIENSTIVKGKVVIRH
ncbi:MAG: hypothetical protein A2W85_05455 [Bacteroidetes bacterium GWF2_41_31]|nr:MAG: hypothetical protein A2W85_05455 [Bacteroidetes bacterium GWF2_41_31]